MRRRFRMQWQRRPGHSSVKTLPDLRQEMAKAEPSKWGVWTFSQEFKGMKVAKFWNLTPSQWDNLEFDDKIRMIAFYDAEQTVMGWENHLQVEDLKKQEIKRGG